MRCTLPERGKVDASCQLLEDCLKPDNRLTMSQPFLKSTEQAFPIVACPSPESGSARSSCPVSLAIVATLVFTTVTLSVKSQLATRIYRMPKLTTYLEVEYVTSYTGASFSCYFLCTFATLLRTGSDTSAKEPHRVLRHTDAIFQPG